MKAFSPRRSGDGAERHLCAQLPAFRQVPGLVGLRIYQRVVVLQAGADLVLGEGGPDRELGHAAGLLRPHREVVGVEGELLLKLAHYRLVFEEQYGAGTGGEGIELGFGGGESVGGNDLLQLVLGDVPELLVLGAEQDDHPRALRVERGRAVRDGLLDQFDDFLLGDGQLLVQGVDGAAVLDGGEECVRHREAPCLEIGFDISDGLDEINGK